MLLRWRHLLSRVSATDRVPVPVHVGGLAVRTGDLIHCDQNGVTNIPLPIAAEVADACEEFCNAESVVLDYCQAGDVSVEGFAEVMKELRSRVKGLKARLRRR